jgi:hypothetical protein
VRVRDMWVRQSWWVCGCVWFPSFSHRSLRTATQAAQHRPTGCSDRDQVLERGESLVTDSGETTEFLDAGEPALNLPLVRDALGHGLGGSTGRRSSRGTASGTTPPGGPTTQYRWPRAPSRVDELIGMAAGQVMVA